MTVSGEQEWRQLYSVLPLEEVKRQAQLFAAAPDLLGSSSKAPKRTGRKAASDEDERFLDEVRQKIQDLMSLGAITSADDFGRV